MVATFPYERTNRLTTTLVYDFVTGFNRDNFDFLFGDDGKLCQDGGLVINSSQFTKTRPYGPSGYMDHFKCAPFYKQVIEFPRNKEVLLNALVSSKQVFQTNSIPSAFARRYFDKLGDPRFCHGFFGFTDPKTGIIAAFVITDHDLYVMYGRDDALSGCDVLCGATNDCVPCVAMQQIYTCVNFDRDPNYLLFRQNMNEGNFPRWVLYVQWANWAQKNQQDIFDWQLFRTFQQRYPEICAAPLPNQAFSSWRSLNSYTDYCLSVNWNRWLAGYTEQLCDNNNLLPAAMCLGDSCSNKLFGGRPPCSVCSPGSATACGCRYIDNSNCHDGKPRAVGDVRSCCCPVLASFLELHHVMKLERCDPFCAFLNLTIGVNRGTNVLKFYNNLQQVYQINNVGSRVNDEDRVLEFGGNGSLVDVASGLITFGTGSLMDAALPNNFNRMRFTPENLARSQLTPLREMSTYKQLYRNPDGDFVPVTDTPSPGVSTTFATTDSKEYRVFGQGAVFRIRRFAVMWRRPVTDLVLEIDYFKSECCGFVSCTGGNICDIGEDSLANYIDPRDFDIVIVYPDQPIIGDDAGLPLGKRSRPDCGGPAVACGPALNATQPLIRAYLVRTEQGQRYFERNYNTDFTGIDPTH